MLKNRNIVLGVTGGIAAYKAADVASRLMKLNGNVKVIMTKNSLEFVRPLTFQSITNNYVIKDMFDEPRTWDVEHISLAKEADLFLISPATANFIGKIANGIADDMLTTTVMATKATVMIAPAMNTNMYLNPIVQENISKLKKLGYKFIEPKSGRLACGDVGVGKLEDPETIVEKVVFEMTKTNELSGKKILVTAGPTRESLDPVRYLSNHSSGKMGYSIAEEAARRGGDVTLVSGPTNLKTPLNIETIQVESAQEMYEEVMKKSDCDIIIKAAAVADYRPAKKSENKIKKMPGDMSLSMERNKDILFELGKIKSNQILIGFAAETNDVISNAKEKILKKNLDMIVSNNVKLEGAGFKGNTNIVSFIKKDGEVKDLQLMTKENVAKELLDEIILMVKNH